MAEANTNSVQQAQDAQHLDNLTSLQQGGPQNGNSAGGTADATVNTSNPNQPDNPSLFNNANPVNNNNGDLTAKGNDSVLTPSAFANDGREGGAKDTPTVSTGTQRPEINPAAANAAPAAYQNPLPDIRGNNGIQEGPTSPAAPAAQQATQTINQPSTIAAVKTETEPTTEPTVNDKNLPNQPANGVPTSGVISGAAASLVLDESAVPTPLQNPVINDGINDGIHSVTVNLASQFTHDYGNNGPGSIAYTLSLNGSNVGSGLYALDTGDKSAADGDGYGQGSEIVLNQSGNIITGSVGDKTYFMITVNPATGEVTFAQSNNIWHPTSGASIPDADDSATLAVGSGNLTLIQTVSDADGDSASSSLNLGAGVFSIQDDGPTSGIILGASASLTLDESSLPAAGDGIHTISADLSNQFSYTYGKDGAGSVVYTLSLSADGIGSGLYALDTGDKSAADGDGYGQGNEILLKLVDGEVRGYIDGKTYFTITVNPATGEVTFTQSSNIWNQTPGSGSPDEAAFLTLSTADQLTLVQTVLDGDGDSASSSLNLGAGVFSIQDDGPVVTGLASSGSITNQASASILKSLPTASLGTDGGQLVFGGSHTTVAGIDYWTDGAGHQLTSGGQLLIYTVDSKTGVMTATTADPTHKLIFTVTPDSSKGVYTVTMSGELDGNAKIQTADFTKALSGGNTTNAYFGNTSGTVVWATSTSDGVTPSTVNYSTQGVGVGNGSKINAGESLKLSFIQNPSLDGSGLGEKDPSTPTSPKYLLVNTATFTLDHFDQGENLVVKAYYTDNLGRHIVEVNLSKTSGSGVGSSTAADEPITITSKVIGQTFDTVVFEGVDDGGNGYRVANFTGYNSNEISENRITLTMTAIDGDNDQASTSWNVNFTAPVVSGSNESSIPTSGLDPDAPVAALSLDESAVPTPLEKPVISDGVNDGIHSVTVSLADQFSYTYGKDGAGSVVYTLSLSADGIGSGLYALDTGDKSAADGDGYGQGNEILLKLVDGEVRGYIDGKTYFTITVNPATGEVTFTQSSNIWNQTPGSGSPDEAAFLTLSTADQLTLVQTVLDGDGDSASSSLNLGAGVFSIQDDGPVVTGLASSGSITNQASASILKSLPTASLGTDGGQLVFGGSHTTVAGIDYWTDGAGHQLTSGGQLLIYTVDSKTGVMTATTADPTHKLIFTVTPDSSKGVYTVTMSGELDGNAKIQTADFTKALSGGNTTNAYFGNTSGTVVWATSTSDGVTPSTVNYSTQGVGVGNGSKINAGESLKLSFIQNPSLDGSGLGEKDPSTPTSPKYLLVNTATFTLDHFDQGENLVVKAYYTDNLGRHIVEVNLSKTSGSGVGSSTAADEPITITSKVIGQTFDTVVFEGVDDGGNGYRVANFTGYNSNEISENRITLTMTAIDGDNDQASTSWNVNFTAPVVNLQIASLMQSALDATSNSSFTVSENSIDVGMVINTTLDPASLIYSIVDGVDADKFIINSAGKLSFNNSPNYELPSDFDHDNVYNVIVRVSDGIHSAEYDMDVTVTDVNEAPTAVIISSVTSSLAENTSTTSRIKVADIAVADDAMGSEKISLSGTDAGYFELRGMSLYLKENTPLNYEAKASYDVTVTVADESLVGSTPLSTNYRLSVTDVNEAPTAVVLSGLTSSLAENTSTTSRIKVADIAVTDDALGNEKISLSGADENAFEVIGSELYIKAGISLNYEAKASYDVTVTVADESLVGSTPLSTNYKLRVTDVNESPIVSGETYSFVKNTASPIGNLFSNDSDPDGDAISIAKIKIGSTETNFSSLGNGSGVYSEYKKITMESGGGVLYLKSDGHFIFEAPNSLKTPTFQYAVTDGVNQSSYVTAKFTVTNSPIAMDINGDGIHYLSQEAGTTHDFNADGIAETTAWVAPEDGLLALQKDDGSHNIVFSTQAGETDLAGLAKVYDSNKDGQLNSSDADFAKFGVWQDANSDGIVQNGEFLSLADRGITSLSLTSDGQVHFEANGDVIVYGQTTYTTSDGQLHIAEDVGFAVNDVYEPLDIATLISNAEAIESITHIDQLGDTASSSSLMVELGGQTYEIATLNGQEAGTQDILSQFVGGDTSNNLLANKSWTDVIDIASDHGGPSSITAAGGAVADGAYSNGEGDWTVIVKSGDAKVDAAHNQITFSSESAENSVTIITADGASHDINNVDKIQWHG